VVIEMTTDVLHPSRKFATQPEAGTNGEWRGGNPPQRGRSDDMHWVSPNGKVREGVRQTSSSWLRGGQ
jgi:hypothetical protein